MVFKTQSDLNLEKEREIFINKLLGLEVENEISYPNPDSESDKFRNQILRLLK